MSKIIACSEVKLPVPRTYNVTVILETLGAMTKYYIWEKKNPLMFRNLLALSITGREKILQKDKPTLIYSFDGSSSPIELKTQKNPYTTKGGGDGKEG